MRRWWGEDGEPPSLIEEMLARKARWQERAERRERRRAHRHRTIAGLIDLDEAQLGLWPKPELPRWLRPLYVGRPAESILWGVTVGLTALLVAFAFGPTGPTAPSGELMSVPLALLAFAFPLALASAALLLQREPSAKLLVAAYVSTTRVRPLAASLVLQVAVWFGVVSAHQFFGTHPGRGAVAVASVWLLWNTGVVAWFLFETFAIARSPDHYRLLRNWLRSTVLPNELAAILGGWDVERALSLIAEVPHRRLGPWTRCDRTIDAVSASCTLFPVAASTVGSRSWSERWVHDVSPRRLYHATVVWLRWELQQPPQVAAPDADGETLYRPRLGARVGGQIGRAGALVHIVGRERLPRLLRARFRLAVRLRADRAGRFEQVIADECGEALRLLDLGDISALERHLERLMGLFDWAVRACVRDASSEPNFAESEGNELLRDWIQAMSHLSEALGRAAQVDERVSRLVESFIEQLGVSWGHFRANGTTWCLFPVEWLFAAATDRPSSDEHRRHHDCVTRVVGAVRGLATKERYRSVRAMLGDGAHQRLTSHHVVSLRLLAIAVCNDDTSAIQLSANLVSTWADDAVGADAERLHWDLRAPFAPTVVVIDEPPSAASLIARANDGRIGLAALILTEPQPSDFLQGVAREWLVSGEVPSNRQDEAHSGAWQLTLVDVLSAALRLGSARCPWWHDMVWDELLEALSPPPPRVPLQVYVGTGSRGLRRVWDGIRQIVWRLHPTDGELNLVEERFRRTLRHDPTLAGSLRRVAAEIDLARGFGWQVETVAGWFPDLMARLRALVHEAENDGRDD